MLIEVRGKNGFEVTKAIENYAKDKLEKVERYFKEELDAFVVCKTYKDHHRVEVTIPTKYYTMRAEVKEEDMYAAIDTAIDKLERQIRKNKTKITRSLQKKDGVSDIFNDEIDLEALERELVRTPVRRKSMTLERMTTDEAITAMEMLGHDFFLYKHDITEKPCVVYMRDDGKYAVIETE